MVSSTLRRLIPVLTLVIALVLVASCDCGGQNVSPVSTTKEKTTPTPSKAAQFQTVNACTLFSETDATTAVGGTPMAAQPSAGAAQQSFCIYAPKDSSSNSQASVFVFAVVYPDQATADAVDPAQIAAAYQVTGVSNAKVVTGIGDKAIEYSATAQSRAGLAIIVFRANVLLIIAISPGNDATKLEALARTAVGNLDKAPKS